MTKKEIRKEVSLRRKELSPEEGKQKSLKIAETLFSLPEYAAAKNILLYIDYKNEVQTKPIIERALADGKCVSAPVVVGEAMVFFAITSDEDLTDGYKGIREPRTDLPVVDGTEGLLVMPGVGFDRMLHRVGYGGGFYDRYTEAHPNLFRAAVAYEFQCFDEVPTEPHDILPQVLITEENLYR